MFQKVKNKLKAPKAEPAVDNKQPFYKHDPLMSTVLIILVFFASQIGAGIIIAFYPGLKNWTAEQGNTWLKDSVIAQFAYVFLAEFFAVWLVFWLIKRIRVAKSKIGLVRPKWRDVLYTFSGFAVYFGIFYVIQLVAQYFINTNQAQQIGFDTAHGNQLYYVFAALVILPPIAEEIMFRGFLFTSFRRKFKLIYAVIMTSVLFGIAHLQFGSGAPPLWVAALDTFTLSCVLCVLREKSGSLWPGIYLHMLKNGIAFLYLFHAKF